jgi:hypothetical protein
MRNTQNITINDDGVEIKFKLTALSAVALQKWIIKTGVALAESGLLEVDVGNNFSVDAILSSISKKGLGFLGKLDPDKANNLIIDLVTQSAVKLTGAGVIQLSEKELENTFTSIQALFELEKQCLGINFDFFQHEKS